MKVRISLTDDLGNTYDGEMELTQVARAASRATSSRKPKAASVSLDAKAPGWSLGLGAFLKRHITSKTTGHEKFVMLLAWMTKGSPSKTVAYEEVVAQWNKVKRLTGGAFNPAYTTRAKDANWVDTPRVGVYKLQSDWKEAFRR